MREGRIGCDREGRIEGRVEERRGTDRGTTHRRGAQGGTTDRGTRIIEERVDADPGTRIIEERVDDVSRDAKTTNPPTPRYEGSPACCGSCVSLFCLKYLK